jgi:hypothetical protein
VQPDQIARVVLAFVVGLCLVGLLAYARGEPGDDGREPDGPASAAALVGGPEASPRIDGA